MENQQGNRKLEHHHMPIGSKTHLSNTLPNNIRILTPLNCTWKFFRIDNILGQKTNQVKFKRLKSKYVLLTKCNEVRNNNRRR